MTSTTTPFHYPPSLQEYAVTAEEYLDQHSEYHVLCTGVVVFDKTGKLLLVQRAADEKAFPNLWVRDPVVVIQKALSNSFLLILTPHRRSQAAKSTTPIPLSSMQLCENSRKRPVSQRLE
jgi:hypothetical protein